MGCILLLGCKQEVLEPEQMIQGKFALVDGSGLTDQYLDFDNGFLTVFTLDESYPFAEGEIWHFDATPVNSKVVHRYTISGENIYTSDGPNGIIELKDGILTMGGLTYAALEGFEKDTYSRIIVDSEVVVPFVAQDNNISYSIERPIPAGELTAKTAATWIHTIEVKNDIVSFITTATKTERAADINLFYPHANPVSITVKQAPSTFIHLQENTRIVSYAASTQTLDYTIENPVEGSELSVSTTADWVRNISIQSNKVIFDVLEYNTGARRTASLLFTYAGAEDVTFTLTQNWEASSIVLTPSSAQFDYPGGTGSFTFEIQNPREGVIVAATSQADWITDVVLSGNSVSYRVEENNTWSRKIGIIELKYGSLASGEVTITQSGNSALIPDGAVDLGLSVLWAFFNLGESGFVSSPEEYGAYYAWGETVTKSDYSWSIYKWCNGSSSSLTKYNTKSSSGTVDNKTQLELSDDVARQKLGGSWRMPTSAEFYELINNCTMTWTTQNGVDGRLFTSKKNGKSIFLPAAGFRDGSSLYGAGSSGYYRSSSLNSYYPYDAYDLYFRSSNVTSDHYIRCYGRSVRPVSE